MEMVKTLIISSLLAGALSLDLMAAFQFMLSRPLVAATLCGAALGEPGAGLSFGCLMEMIWSGAVPVGSVVPPDFCVASVFGTATAVLMRHWQPGLGWEACLVWALLWSLPVALLGGFLDQAQRRWQEGLARRATASLEAGDESALGRAVAISLGWSFARGFIFVALAVAVFATPMAFLLDRVFAQAREAFESMYWLGLMLGFVVLVDQFWERRWLRASAASFVASAVMLYDLGLKGSTVLGVFAALALIAATVQERRSRA
jgi:mannose/fructose/N-acetylgalactosamine-specific phosphotransferase system component IIC